MTSSEIYALLVRCWHDAQTNATQLQVIQADTGKEIQLNNGTFLFRVSVDSDPSTFRCLIRHLESGREAYIQSGQAMQAFIEHCLLAKTTTPGTSGEDADDQNSSQDT